MPKLKIDYANSLAVRHQVFNPIWCWMYPYFTFAGKHDGRFRAFGVGLSKTGTHSLAASASCYSRAAHEPCRSPLNRALISVIQGRSEQTISRMLVARDKKLKLEFEVDHVLGTLITPLYRAFPDAKYVLTVRDARSWLQSEISQQQAIRLRRVEYVRYEGRYTHTKYDKGLGELGFYPIKSYLAYWCEHNHRILGLIPKEQLFVIRINEIPEQMEALSKWLGVTGYSVNQDTTKQYVRASKIDLSKHVDEGYLRDQVELHCAGLEQFLGLRNG